MFSAIQEYKIIFCLSCGLQQMHMETERLRLVSIIPITAVSLRQQLYCWSFKEFPCLYIQTTNVHQNMELLQIYDNLYHCPAEWKYHRLDHNDETGVILHFSITCMCILCKYVRNLTDVFTLTQTRWDEMRFPQRKRGPSVSKAAQRKAAKALRWGYCHRR